MATNKTLSEQIVDAYHTGEDPEILNTLEALSTTELAVLDGITSSTAELNLLDGSSTANSVASKAAVLDAQKQLITSANVGTANTGVTAVEYGDGRLHQTVLTVSVTDAVDIDDTAALADGYLLYTFPAGAIVIESAYMSMALTVASTEAQSDTPDVGLGTVIASGAVATLDGTGTFEDIITGQTAADANGSATVKTAIPTAGTPFVIETGDAHTLHFNVADTWANDTGGDLTGDIAGTIVVNWRFMA